MWRRSPATYESITVKLAEARQSSVEALVFSAELHTQALTHPLTRHTYALSRTAHTQDTCSTHSGHVHTHSGHVHTAQRTQFHRLRTVYRVLYTHATRVLQAAPGGNQEDSVAGGGSWWQRWQVAAAGVVPAHASCVWQAAQLH